MGRIAVLAAVLISAQGFRARILGRMPTVLVSCSCSASCHRRQRNLRPGRRLSLHATCLTVCDVLTLNPCTVSPDYIYKRNRHMSISSNFEGGGTAVFRI